MGKAIRQTSVCRREAPSNSWHVTGFFVPKPDGRVRLVTDQGPTSGFDVNNLNYNRRTIDHETYEITDDEYLLNDTDDDE